MAAIAYLSGCQMQPILSVNLLHCVYKIYCMFVLEFVNHNYVVEHD